MFIDTALCITTDSNGTAVFGPLATTWFGFLQRRVRIPSSPNMEILARVGLDQTVLAPTNLFVFLSSMAIMEGSDPSKKIETTYWNALSKNWMLWPFVQAVNFKFVPLQHRVLVVNVVSLGMCCSFSNYTCGILTKSRLELLPLLPQLYRLSHPQGSPSFIRLRPTSKDTVLLS